MPRSTSCTPEVAYPQMTKPSDSTCLAINFGLLPFTRCDSSDAGAADLLIVSWASWSVGQRASGRAATTSTPSMYAMTSASGCRCWISHAKVCATATPNNRELSGSPWASPLVVSNRWATPVPCSYHTIVAGQDANVTRPSSTRVQLDSLFGVQPWLFGNSSDSSMSFLHVQLCKGAPRLGRNPLL